MSVVDNSFNPACTRLAIGTTVTWTNNGGASHNVTFDNNAVGNSPDLPAGATFQKSFGVAGEYTYRCTLHGGMNGTVEIQ